MALIDTTKRHYDALLPKITDEEHPVDQILLSMPEVATVDRRARSLAEHLSEPRNREDQEVWNRYEDLRFEQRVVWMERGFDLGFEYGRVAGLAASLADAHHEAVESVSRALQDIAIGSALDRKMTLAAFLAVARAIVLAEDDEPRGPPTSAQA